ncbi:ComEC/Rec2 family competence protein [Hoeflea olei]|uniref:ComEC/Rec2-related protein domain-containing protein n=1 Tax=Hoeflea olei TaxID=1480615 RepID=A0A1C1YSR6_9HYPH|nr:ComEC/Rec2 family competence protein [Hoeflea olei]OCW56571.1 hypothetical protein AWJ14_16640 [Hoeflea olei]
MPRRATPAGADVQAPSVGARLGAVLSREAARESGRGVYVLLLPVAMGAGAGLYYMLPRDPLQMLLLAGLVIALAVAAAASARHLAVARGAGLVAALCAGAAAASVEQGRGAVLLDQDVTTTLSGTVEAREFDADGRVRYLIRVATTKDPVLSRPPARVRLVARAPHEPVAVGDTLSGRARLSAPSGPVIPGGYDYAFRAFIDGIGAHGFFYRAPEPGRAGEAGSQGAMVRAVLFLRSGREAISARIRSVLPGDPGGIAAALAVSDRRGISAETVDALRATGLAHILAISGLHMALAAGTLYLLVRKLLAAVPALVEALPVKKLAATGALFAATAYLLISGGSVATQRAWVMLAIMLVAVLADRPALTLRNVALAALLIILLTPSAVVGPGFQMSFAATAALISAYAAISERRASRPGPAGPLYRPAVLKWGGIAIRAILGLALTSLVAGLATGLFSAHHFHRVAGNGVLANLLAMPLVTFVVMPAGVLALLAMPFGLDTWPLRLMGKGLEGVIAAARYVEGLGGDITVGQIPLLATVTAGCGFLVLVLLKSRLRLAGIALIGLAAGLALPPLRGSDPDILVSEDGRLLALSTPDGLATNAARPGEFVFRQWQAALRRPAHLAPASLAGAAPASTAAGTGKQPAANAGNKADWETGGPAAGDSDSTPSGLAVAEARAMLDRLLAAAELTPSRFVCASRGICAAVHRDIRIIAVDRADLIGAGCDRADLLVVAIPVHMRACRSGAKLVTSRTLRASGALAIRIQAAGGTPPGSALASTAAEARYRPGPRPALATTAAVAGVIRPWTIQRYYDWRTRSYDPPD